MSRRLAVALSSLLLLAAVEIGGTLISVPMNQIQEGIICRHYYPDVIRPSHDPRCKNSDVQSELSMLQGWELTFGLTPGLLTAVPYGIAADKHGRKAILSLSLLGILMVQAVDIIVCRFPQVFSIRFIWLGATCCLIGGGPFVFSAMVFAIVSDVSTQAQSPLAYVAMERGAWFSVAVGFGCLSVSVLIALAFPETRDLTTSVHHCAVSEDQDDDSDDENDDASSCGHVAPPDLPSRFSAAHALERVTDLAHSMFWENKRLGILLSSLLFTTLGRYVSTILMQYTTKRFGWTWSEAGLLSSVSASVHLVLVAAMLPLMSQVLLVKLELTPLAKDLWLARASIVALTTGAFGIGLASSSATLVGSLMIYSLGSGYAPAMRSLLGLVAGDSRIGTLFTTISVLENMGMLIAGPVMAAAFRVGLGWGGAWIGLPFISAGILLACAAVIVIGVRPKTSEGGDGRL